MLANTAKGDRIYSVRTKKETVTVALEELIRHHEQKNILKAAGTIRFRDDWNYKKDRRDRFR
ncbi:MAG: type II toxin-antitoxin system VapB family antitoxin [Planctomycetaceae bacterium]|nr:type II toxin-antitoxin system VapB family antitoxin [Planctomycetaceae bacterium]